MFASHSRKPDIREFIPTREYAASALAHHNFGGAPEYKAWLEAIAAGRTPEPRA